MFQKHIMNAEVDPTSFRLDSGRCIKHSAFEDAVIKNKNFCFIYKGLGGRIGT
jgi:hypothetical protein